MAEISEWTGWRAGKWGTKGRRAACLPPGGCTGADPAVRSWRRFERFPEARGNDLEMAASRDVAYTP